MRAPHSIPAAFWLLGSVLAAAVSALDPFDHGVWLATYLFLVGFAAQLLLARGQSALFAARPGDDVRAGLQPMLWNAGVILVPAGVLIEARSLVVAGAVTLLATLIILARSAGETRPRELGHQAWRWRGQVALIAFMAVSVLVGTALAWDTPWL